MVGDTVGDQVDKPFSLIFCDIFNIVAPLFVCDIFNKVVPLFVCDILNKVVIFVPVGDSVGGQVDKPSSLIFCDIFNIVVILCDGG